MIKRLKKGNMSVHGEKCSDEYIIKFEQIHFYLFKREYKKYECCFQNIEEID